jgi:UDP-N-acetylmuramate dehydrogenase
MQVPELVRICSDRGYSGMEDLAAIPGSVGGAVVMNAGAGSQCFSDVLRRICIVKKGSVYHLEPAQLDFGYRRSGIQADMVVLEAQIHLDYVGIQECRERRRAALQHRKQAQKVGMPNAGSVFRNPPGLSAWKVIDACGLRGFKLGGAQISPQHTNFIINTGTASAADIQALIAHVQRKAYESSGIRLEPEVRFLSEGLNAYET